MVAIIHHPGYTADTPAGHRFPMSKFALLAQRLRETGYASNGFLKPVPAPIELLCHAHDRTYVEAVLDQTLDARAVRKIGFPLNDSVVTRARLATGGTVLAARTALQRGIACNTAGGSHHAHAGFGAGFCVFNDVAVAVSALLEERTIRQALIIDLDVHHGDGTAAIFARQSRAFTFSMHCEANWPLERPPSDLDMELPAGTGDEAYLEALRSVLPGLIDRVRPDLAFFIAGVDVHRDDRLGKLAMSDQGIARRDHMVLRALKSARVPVATVLGGGYNSDASIIAARHAITFEQAAKLWD
jgi:acetoin utilization deacetylase AcuC-like enzyme